MFTSSVRLANWRLAAGACLALIAAGWTALSSGAAQGYSPEDPQVRQVVDRGIRYLESLTEEQIRVTPYGGADGQAILIPYAHLKAEGNPEAPLVKVGLKHALKLASDIESNNGKLKHLPKSHYEIPVAIMFLAELDAQQYRPKLEALGNAMLALQQSHGGFGYPGDPHGDVSQVQYVVLALWTLDRAGIELPLDKIASTVAWLSRVQDPSGFWPYHGHDPGVGRGLIAQPRNEMSISTCLAGGSSILIGADIFRVWGQNAIAATAIEGMPKAIKPVEREDLIDSRRKKAPLTKEEILAAIKRMEAFRSRFPFKRTGTADWYYYMLYTMERYESFLEVATGTPSRASWYDDGVTALMGFQDSSGAWGVKDASKNSPPVSTSFAILFLIRGTKKSIGKVSEGRLAGGFGLPPDTSKILVSGTQIKGDTPAEAVTDLLSLLESDDADEFDQKTIPEDLELETDPERRRQQLARLERVVRGSKSWQARRVAARLLGASDDMKVAPSLIFALSDPDKLVRTYALDGLRFISRRFDASAIAEPLDAQKIRESQQPWIQWYQSIYPSFTFADY